MADSTIRVSITGHSERYRAALSQATRSTREFRQEQQKTVLSSRALEFQTRQLNRALAQQSRQLGALTLQWYQFRQALFTAGLRTAVTGFAALTASVGALAGGIVMLTQQLSLFATGLATVGTSGLMALGQGMIVATLGLKGIGKALTTVGKEHENALKKLTPAARTWVGELAPVREAFREIKALAQEGLFRGLTKATRELMPLLKPVKDAVYQTARSLGYLAERFGEVMGGRSKDVGALMQRNIVTMRRMGDSSINIVRAMMDIFRAADPFIGHVTRQMVTFTEKIADLSREARKDGKLGSFFYDVQQAWDQWLSILGNVGGTLFNVLKAAAGPAKVMADAIERTTQKWQDWTGDSAGQGKLTKFFTASNKVLGSMARFSGAVVKHMANLTIAGADSAVRFFDLMRTKFLPVLEELAIMMDKGVFTHLMDFMSAFLDLVKAAMPGLKPFAEVLGLIARMFVNITEGITGLVNRMPDFSKVVGALTLGAVVIGSWGKLRLAIALTVLEMRRLLGLIPELSMSAGPWSAAGRRQLTSRGGSPDGLRNEMSRQEGGGGGSTVVPGLPGGRGGGGARPSARQVIRDAVHPKGLGVWNYGSSGQYPAWHRGIAEDIASGSGVQRVRNSIYPQTYGPRRSDVTRGGQPFGGGVGTVRPMNRPDGGVRRGRTSPSAQYEADRNIDRTRPLRAIEKPIAFMSGQALRTGAALKGLVPEITGAIKPFGTMALAAAGFSGAISALGQGGNFADRTQNFFSGATFGLVPSADAQKGKIAGDEARYLKKSYESGEYGGKGAGGGKVTDAQMTKDLERIKKLNITGEARKALADYINQWRSGATKVGGYTKKMADLIKSGLDLGGVKAQVVTEKDSVVRAFQDIAQSGGKSMDRIKAAVKTATAEISGYMGKDSEAGRLAMAKNFRLAAAAVRASMAEGKISAKEGTAAIRGYLISALQEVNPEWNRKQAGRYLHGRDPLTNTPINAETGRRQRGGFASLNGKPGQDSIPIVAAPGEDMAIFTRHQRRVVDERLADMGGLPGLFSNVNTEHNKPAAFARGGMVTGDTDYSPTLGKRLEALAKAAGQSIYVQEGGRTIAEQAARYQTYLNGGNVAAKPTPNAPHVRGVAADITPGQAVFGRLAAKFGLGFPVPGEPWHIQLMGALAAGAAGAGGGGGATTKPTLKKYTTKLKGMIGALTQGGLDKVHSAAEKTLDRAFEEFGAVAAGGESDPTASISRGGKGWRRTGGTTFGGPADPGTGFIGYRGDDLRQVPNSFAELSMGRALGGLPYKQAIKVRVPKSGRTMTVRKRDIGAGGGPVDGMTRGIDLWWQAAQKLGLGNSWSGALDWKMAARGLLAHPEIAGRASASIPGRDTPTPDVDTTPQSTSGSSKKKSKAKKKPFAAHLGTPGERALKRAKRRAKRPKPKRMKDLAAWLRSTSADEWIDQILTGSGYGPKRQEGLDTEYLRRTTLFDAHSGDYQAWLGTFSDQSLIPEGQRVGKIDALLAELTGNAAGTAPMIGDDLLSTFAAPGVSSGGIMDILLQQMTGEASGISSMKGWGPLLNVQMKYLREVFKSKLKIMRNLNDRMSKMRKDKPTWNEAVHHNDATIKDYEEYLSKQQKRATTMRLTARDKKDMKDVRDRIKALRKQNTRLRKNKPKTVGMGKEQKEQYQGYELDRNRAQGYLTYIGGDQADNEGKLANADPGSVYGLLREHLDATKTMGGTLKSLYTQHWSDYRGKLNDATSWIADRANKPEQPKADDSYLKSQIEEKNKALAISSSLSEVFRGFAPMLGMRYVGAFQHGTNGRVIGETGLALLHKDEIVTPDPSGPFGNRAGANVNVAGAQVQLVVNGELAPLIRLIDARIDGRAPQIVNQELGRSRRVSRISPGR